MAMGEPAVGRQAPEFSLQDETGSKVSLADLLKKGPVLLVFYPGDFTPVCTKQLCDYRDNQAKFDGLGVQVIGISSDTGGSHDKFRKEYGLPFKLLSDPGNQTAKAYGCQSLFMLGQVSRGVFVVNQRGTIAYRYVEPTPITRRKSDELVEVVESLKRESLI